MVNLTIDRLPVSVKEGTTLMEAAESIGIHIPHLCYWKGLNEIAACRVCVVELEGRDHLITAGISGSPTTEWHPPSYGTV